jgi:hypothetical protein
MKKNYFNSQNNKLIIIKIIKKKFCIKIVISQINFDFNVDVKFDLIIFFVF